MAWNEPGNNGNGNGSGKGSDKDPWGGGGRRGDQGPPDIDEVIKNLSKKFGSIFGGSGGGSKSGGGPSARGLSGGLIAGLVVVVVVLWGFTGFYSVDAAERGVVLRFGKVIDAIVQPGLRWNPPGIDQVFKVNVRALNTETYESRAMLTYDENIIDISVVVQYRILNPVNFVISVENPKLSLDNASNSAIRHVVGGTTMDDILTTGRDRVAEEVHARVQDYMEIYTTGIVISQVNVIDAQPPDAVRPAFDDVIVAREDEVRFQNEAQQYANRIIPEARGDAQRQIEEANAYRAEAIAIAEGEASRFSQLLDEYQKAPEVTRVRLYLESMQEIMSASSKIMIDVEGGNNMLYLPLDKMMEQGGSVGSSSNQELRDLARRLEPYFNSTLGAGSVDRSRLPSSGRGGR